MFTYQCPSYPSCSIVVLRRRKRKVSNAAQQKNEVKQPQSFHSTGQDTLQMEQNTAYTTVDYQLEGYYEQLT